MMNFTAETALALAYSGFLIAIASVFELVARHVHHRSERSTTAGFSFHHDLDAWECPDGRLLHREHTDSQLQIVRYRAPAHHCNTCIFKFRCTDSMSGRVIEHRVGSWMESGLYRFHRAMSVALLTLAGMILMIELLRNHNRESEAVIAASLIFVAAIIMRFARGLRASAQHDSSDSDATSKIAA